MSKPLVIETTVKVNIEINWPNTTTAVGRVYVNGYLAHELSFKRVMPQDAPYGTTGFWKLGEDYFLTDVVLIHEIEQRAKSALAVGRLHLAHGGG